MMFWSVPPIWEGETVAILAGGPSLTDEAVDRLDRLDGPAVLAINLSYRKIVRPGYSAPMQTDILFAADVHRTWAHYPEMAEFPALEVVLWGVDPPEEKQEAMQSLAGRGVKVLRHLGRHDGLSDDPGVLRGNNGIHQCINLSVLAGAKRILLLGCDLRAGEGGKVYHHIDGLHPWQKKPPNFPRQIESIETTVAPLRKAGLEVLNCSPGSALTCFPMVTIKEALG